MEKKLFALLIVLLGITNLNAQTLLTYGPYKVSKEEFLRAFKKNNNDSSSPANEAIRNYLDLYTRYKLKVRSAYDMKLDTLPSQKAELEAFREQVRGNYLIDDSTLRALSKEALQRSATDIRLAHIYIPYSGEKDAEQARAKALAAADELGKGIPFEQVALKYSADPAVKTNKGELGWIAAFTLPYSLETLAYTTPLKGYSKPFQSPRAWHIFHKLEERPAKGSVWVAQILLGVPGDASPAEKAYLKGKADSIYTALRNGADFAVMAREFSTDNFTYNNEGILQPFIPGTYEAGFEEVAFALKEVNGLSQPFQTSQGYHILKLLRRDRPVLDESEEAMANMRNKLMGTDRYAIAQDAIERKASRVVGFKELPLPRQHVDAYAAAVWDDKVIPSFSDLSPNSVMATIGKTPVKFVSFINYLAEQKQDPTARANRNFEDHKQAFLRKLVMEEYSNNLEKYDPAFAAQVKEFRDGNLLFEAMQRKVWDKASNDTNGLRKYYEQNKGKYLWEPGIDGILFSTTDSVALALYHQQVKQAPKAWRELLTPFQNTIQADSGRYEYQQLPGVPAGSLARGMVSPMKVNEADGNYSFIIAKEVYPSRQPRTYVDAIGLAMNDYQSFLEEEWIRSLKKTYPVKVNEPVLQSILTKK
ncbi:peptidylprolyl isomerase [Flavihumibacter rivuli]|uniref:foldase protein PrsA n=1 Tax=Flavihumibacter rivuli TaxID=2838156 RepID=UPI001BDF4136|nr:peptidylprolyl isomerase [Flavihumibacter rivuli]ULQ55354.1 peptidylprolyl isomerase [Flavihumibacter rivuli]